MKTKFGNLLGLIAKDSDRDKFLQLSQQYNESRQARKPPEPGGSLAADLQNEEIIDQLMKQLQWHFRAIRYPMPTRQEIEEMIYEHFK
ncbi:MAG: hypothetical protein LC778_09765 [Acidobacteria bacterium]|nr:hypothetical protein [Acidobacteriota bacterium]